MRLKELIYYEVSEIDGEVIALGTHYDHVCSFINALPELAPSQIIYKVKGHSSHALRKKYPWLKTKMPSLWTRSYLYLLLAMSQSIQSSGMSKNKNSR